MNVVQVRHIEDRNAKRYTYRVPKRISLLKGDVVRVKNVNGKESMAICVTDSEALSDNAIDMVMSGNKVLSDVITRYLPIPLVDETDELVDTQSGLEQP